MRRSSCEFAAKCLTQAEMPFDCTPRISAAADLPDRYGSSEKYSKLRPHRGLRFMLQPGPKSTLMPSLAASRPSARPSRSIMSVSHEFARLAAVGKQVAGTDLCMPK